jgi:Co/Zn/Cd efflux system component
MEGNPGTIDTDEVAAFLYRSFPDIQHVKDMHIWGLSSEKIILVTRIRTEGALNHLRETMQAMKRELKDRFGFIDVFIEGYEAGHLEEMHEERSLVQGRSRPSLSSPAQG